MTTFEEAVIDVAQGNVGALTVCISILKKGRMDIATYLMENGPKGSDLWILFKDENGENLEQLMMELELRMMLS